MKRIDKENYYLDIAETVLERSTCLRRRYGAIVVKNDEIRHCPPGRPVMISFSKQELERRFGRIQ